MRADTLINRDLFIAFKKSLFLLHKSAEHTVVKDTDLTLAQLDVLMTVYALGSTSQQLVAEMLQNTQASVSRQVSILLRKKLISRTQNLKNKREYTLVPTTLGIDCARASMNILDVHFEKVFSVVPRDERKKMTRHFQSVMKHIKSIQGADPKIFARMELCEKTMRENLKKL